MSSQTDSKTSAPGPWARVRLGIFARVYAFDLVLAALAVVASIVVMQDIIDSKLKNQVHSLARWMVDEAFDTGNRDARDRLLLRLFQSGRVRMTIYDADGPPVGFRRAGVSAPRHGRTCAAEAVRQRKASQVKKQDYQWPFTAALRF